MKVLRVALCLVPACLAAQNRHVVVVDSLTPGQNAIFTSVSGFVDNGREFAILTSTDRIFTISVGNDATQEHETSGYPGPGKWKHSTTVKTTVGTTPTTFELTINEEDGDQATGFIGVRVQDGSGTMTDPVPWTDGGFLVNPHSLDYDAVNKQLGVCDPAGNKVVTYSIGTGALPAALVRLQTYQHSSHHNSVRGGFLFTLPVSGLVEVRGISQPTFFRQSLSTLSGLGHSIAATNTGALAYVTSTAGPDDRLSLFTLATAQLQTLAYTPGPGLASSHGSSVHVNDVMAYLGYHNAGFRGLDITTPTNPVELMRFDNPLYQGQPDKLVGVYPFQPSGQIYLAYEKAGLVVVRSSFSTANYGAGTIGSNAQVPALTVLGDPVIGGTASLATTGGLPNTIAVNVFSLAPSSFPIFGVTVLVDPTLLFATASIALDPSGTGTLVLPLPLNPLILNATFYAQSILRDPPLPFGLSSSQGLRFY